MPLFLNAAQIDDGAVARAVEAAWGLKLGPRLKTSQNVTYAATAPADGSKAVVRAVPGGPAAAARLAAETEAVQFFAAEMGPGAVAGPLPTTVGGGGGGLTCPLDAHSGVSLSAWEWGPGEPLNPFDYSWLEDGPLIRAFGDWLARAHAAGRKLAADAPGLASRLPTFESLHDGLMAGWGAAHLTEEDRAAMAPPAAGGTALVIHSDANVSNAHATRSAEEAGSPPSLCFFDWDQLHWGCPEWDAASTAMVVFMFAEAGKLFPVPGEAVPEARPPEFVAHLMAGYADAASALGAPPLDPARFERMVALRKRFAGAFAEQAAGEHPPPEMAGYLAYLRGWLDGQGNVRRKEEHHATPDAAGVA